jgi:hypothetical protein
MAPEIIRDVFSGDILIRPHSFRHDQYYFDAGLRARPHWKLDRLDKYQQFSLPSEEMLDFVYLELRNMAWRLLSSQQQGKDLALEVALPIPGPCHLEGLMRVYETRTEYRIVVWRIDHAYAERVSALYKRRFLAGCQSQNDS